MLSTARLMAFAATTNAAVARRFYEGVLGLRLVEDTPFALVFDVSGTPLRVQKVEQLSPQPFTVLGWQVADIEASVDELRARGVSFKEFPGMQQDERRIWSAPGGARVAWFNDPDGNTLSLSQH